MTLLFPRASPLQNHSFPSRARQPQQTTSLISAYIHEVSYTARSSHISNVATTPTSVQNITVGSGNHSRNQGHNPNHYERIATCKSCAYWNPQTHTTNENSLGIYTLGDRRREEYKTSHKKLIPQTLLHKDQPPDKRRDQSLKIQIILLLKSLSHYNLRLPQSSNSTEFTVTSWN